MKGKSGLLSVSDFSIEELCGIVDFAKEIKYNPKKYRKALEDKTVVMIFEKPSTRTRVSFECAMLQLGGHAINITRNTMQVERGETLADSARTLERYVDAIVARVNEHSSLIELQKNSRIPVINALSDLEHPCQIISDLYTVYENKGRLAGVNMAYIGDGNNVCNSLLLGSAMTGMNLKVASPKKYMPNKDMIDAALRIAGKTGSEIVVGCDPQKAAVDADFVYTDVWVSMGQEEEEKERMKAFSGFQINEKLLSRARRDAKVMHCLPAHRDAEISADVMDGKRSIVWDQAENRLHAQKAVLIKLLT